MDVIREQLARILEEPSEEMLFVGYQAYAADLGEEGMTGNEKLAHILFAIAQHIRNDLLTEDERDDAL